MQRFTLLILALASITSCRIAEKKEAAASDIKYEETIGQVAIEPGSMKIRGFCGVSKDRCEIDESWKSMGLCVSAIEVLDGKKAEHNTCRYDYMSTPIDTKPLFGRLDQIPLGKIDQMAITLVHSGKIYLTQKSGKNLLIGKIDQDSEVTLVNGVQIVPGINDVEHNIWEKWWLGMKDKTIPFLYILVDTSLDYEFVSNEAIRQANDRQRSTK
jgi:hypothetical protein